MKKLKIEAGDWIIVCDGRKSLILENKGDRVFPNLRMVETQEHDNPPARELGTSAPGRVHSSVGTARSAVEQTDWHKQAEQAFLVNLVRRLDSALSDGKTRHLIIVAPPRALGILRQGYSEPVRKAVRAEIEKDYVKIPVYEIEKKLTGKPAKR